MLIRLGCDIRFELPAATTMIALLNVHPSRAKDLLEPDVLQIEPAVRPAYYTDSFGNLCTRFLAPQGPLRLFNSTLIADTGLPDPMNPSVGETPLDQLPEEALRYLLASRYCEVDLLSNTACSLFGHLPRGW
jgi:hypothetical protein